MSHDAETTLFDWAYLRGIVFEHRRELVIAHFLAILATAATVLLPLLFPVLVDEVLLDQPGWAVTTIQSFTPPAWHGPWLYILTALVVTLVLRLIAYWLNVLQIRQFAKISKDATFRMRRAMLKRLERTSLAEYETLGTGRVTAHFITDLATIDGFLTATVSGFVVAVLTLIGIAAILLWMHWQLALFILLLNPVVIYITTILGRRVRTLKGQENAAVGAFQEALTETLDAIHQVRASNKDRQFFSQLTDSARTLRDRSIAFGWQSDAARRFSFQFLLFGFDIFRAAAMLIVVLSGLTVGRMVAVFSYLWSMFAPIQQLLAMQYSFYAAKAALSRINQLMHLKEEPRYPHKVNPFEGRRTVDVSIEDLDFSYGAGGKVLDGLSLQLAAGEKVGLVGASGGGKSTLVHALLGLYPPTGGMIYFAGVPITEIGLDVVRDNVATVLQQPIIFNDTIRYNLTLGQSWSDEKVWAALEAAQLGDTIRELSEGLETPLGRQGTRFSGGQRQRLAIARLLLCDPKVVILDEATSAVDVETEKQLYKALQAFLHDRTTVIIAHRMSALRHADRLYVIEHGRISEQGRHDQLIASDGLYSKLYG